MGSRWGFVCFSWLKQRTYKWNIISSLSLYECWKTGVWTTCVISIPKPDTQKYQVLGVCIGIAPAPELPDLVPGLILTYLNILG